MKKGLTINFQQRYKSGLKVLWQQKLLMRAGYSCEGSSHTRQQVVQALIAPPLQRHCFSFTSSIIGAFDLIREC